ncbi:MAG TPA: hypothetical protein VML75_04965 [Kofleriaceae bacterium]|nr:hypothetical protein [Kofleriaceae bacterium]
MSSSTVRFQWALSAFALTAFAGCTRTLPPQQPAAVLYRDLERIVTVASTTGWYVDRIELEELETDALLSACAVPPSARADLMAWLDERIAAAGGPVREAYLERGRKLSKVKDLLRLTRIRMALERAVSAAEADCPFWIEPSPAFAGRQISDDRWHLSLGGGGKGTLVMQGSEQDLKFGGAGRLLVGRSTGDRIGLYAGLESGASASFPRDETGERGELVVALDFVAPLVMRYTLVNSYWELEAGPLGTINELDRELIPGVHLGAAVGGRATRNRWFFPGAVFGVSWERTFPDAMQGEPVQYIKVGFRVAIDIDL